MSTSDSSPSLRDHLVSSLTTLGNPFDLELIVVSSLPKRTNALFPHARHPPRCFEKQYVIALGVTLPPPQDDSASTLSPDTPTSSLPLRRRKVLVTALHAYLYTLPHRHILYISKVDTSGYLPSPTPLTKTLITSFIGYHLLPGLSSGAHVQVQLFARSQGQYLFPNSSQAPGKRVAGGLKLCAWWKGVYEAVAIQHAQRESAKHTEIEDQAFANGGGSSQCLRLRYLLPSYSGEEAAGMLGVPKVALPSNLQWTYGPPFTTSLQPKLSIQDDSLSLGLMIPSLPDDPKTRFLDELVAEAGPSRRQDHSKASNGTPSMGSNDTAQSVEGDDDGTDTDLSGPSLKVDSSRALGPKSSGATLVESAKRKLKPATSSFKEKEKERDEADRKFAEAALSKVSREEFWERMGFRQECISGDVTGFFTLELDPPSNVVKSVGGVTPTGIKNSTSRNLGTAASTSTVNAAQDASTLHSVNGSKGLPSGNPGSSTDIPYGLVDRVLASLLNCDFATLTLALESTQIWTDGTRGILVGEIGEKGWEGSTASIPAALTNGAELREKRKEEVVTMLQPRKKKKV